MVTGKRGEDLPGPRLPSEEYYPAGRNCSLEASPQEGGASEGKRKTIWKKSRNGREEQYSYLLILGRPTMGQKNGEKERWKTK